MAEQKIVEMVRKILVDEKGYPDPANCDHADKNGLIMYAQDDYKKNEELYNKIDGLLNHSSKCAEKTYKGIFGLQKQKRENQNLLLSIIIQT